MESTKKDKKRPSYEPTEYMYSSARTRAREAYLIGKEKLARLVEAPSTEALTALATELGYLSAGKGTLSGAAREEQLQEYLARELDLAEEMLSSSPAGHGGELIRILRLPYDCSNVKAAIKCEICGASPDSMMFKLGSVSPELAIEGVRRRELLAVGYPETLCRGAEKAMESYAESKDPRAIDFILDKACFTEMSRLAEESGVPFMKGYVARKIDAVNIMTVLRITRMYTNGGASAEGTLRDAMLSGGLIPTEALAAVITSEDKGEAVAQLGAAVAQGGSPDYLRLSESISSEERPLSGTEQLLDDFIMEYVREGGRAPFGAEITAAYIIGLEGSIKNLRMIFAGREAGLDSAVIRERMRLSYV